MFAKVFYQIFESSISEDYVSRQFFIDLLVLADEEGVVDKTPEAISRITNVPLEIVFRCIEILSRSDDRSRTPDEDGRRIVLVDPPRIWGWRIVNYLKYREIRDQEARRIANRSYKREQRAKSKVSKSQQVSAPVLDSQQKSAQEEAEVEVDVEAKKQKPSRAKKPHGGLYEPVKDLIFRYYRSKNEVDPEWSGREGKALAMLLAANPNAPLDHWQKCLVNRFKSEVAHGDRPGMWLGKLSSFSVPLNQFNKPQGVSNGTIQPQRFESKTDKAYREALEIINRPD